MRVFYFSKSKKNSDFQRTSKIFISLTPNTTIQKKGKKEMDIRFCWVQDWTRQGHYNLFWKPGGNDLAGYFTRCHPHHHQHSIVPIYIRCQDNAKNESERVCNYSHNTSLNVTHKKSSNKETNLQIIKMETHRYMDRLESLIWQGWQDKAHRLIREVDTVLFITKTVIYIKLL